MSMLIDNILGILPFLQTSHNKNGLLFERMVELTKLHYDNCSKYKKILDALNYNIDSISTIESIPFIPVRLFKETELLSIDEDKIFKTMTSSGTSGQAVSKIFLDKETASLQQKVLVKIVANFITSTRLPMIILDSPSVLKDRNMFSARGAGILGFSIFGADKIYALDENMNINFKLIESFLEKHSEKKILLFGFTFMVWQFFYKALKSGTKRINLSNGILIHGGGWKKLVNEAVSKDDFKKALNEVCLINNVHDYYGMVEQTGSIFMECENGHLHTSIFSDIIIRRSKDFSVCNIREKGMIQVLSVIPQSYPGHSILTEDEGLLIGIDDCPCGRKGKYFQVFGRIKSAEIRGCSDTYQ